MLVLQLLQATLATSQIPFPDIPGVGQDCSLGIQSMLDGISDATGETYSGEMIKYSGFKLNDLGDFDNCNDLDDTEYALAMLPSPIPLSYSICGPQACNETEYISLLLYLMSLNITSPYQKHADQYNKINDIDILGLVKRANNLKVTDPATGIEVVFPQHYINEHFDELSSGRIVFTVFMAIIGALCLAGTAWDVWSNYFMARFMKKDQQREFQMTQKNEPLVENQADRRPRQPSAWIQILLSFSIYGNIKKLFYSRAAEKTGDTSPLELLNAVRVMSMCWVIVGHVFLIRSLGHVQNYQDIGDYYGYKRTALVYGAFYSVDTFFWLSGFLMAYLFIAQYQAKGKMNYPMLYVHRFLRILPVYMFTLLFIWSYQKYAGYGPAWINGDMWNNQCKRHWWTNMLFINNFVPDGDGNYCMAWSWYLANDMQFFLLTPIVLYIYHKINKIIGWSILFAFICVHILSSIFIARHYDFYVAGPNEDNHRSQQFDLYEKPYCRCGAYVIGLGCGLIFYANEYYNKQKANYDPIANFMARSIHNWIVRWVMYLLGAALVNIFLFVQRSAYKDQGEIGHDMWSHDERYLWYGFSRIGFVLGISFILMPMLLEHGTLVRHMMSSSIWNPLARLSFSCYLIHFAVIWNFAVSQRQSYYLNDMFIFMDVVTCVICSYGAAFIPYLLAESPAMNLERLLIPMLLKKLGGGGGH